MAEPRAGRRVPGVLRESAQSSCAGSDGRDDVGRPVGSGREADRSAPQSGERLTTVRAVVEYDGTHFCGLQFQPAVRTVAGELERVLSQMLRHPVKITAA